MNVLLFDDLFITICLYFNIKNIINFELISTYHHRLIRKTTWFLPVLIKNEISLKYIIEYYHFKNLDFYFNVNPYIDYLKTCHTLNLPCSNITNENIKALGNCYALNLSNTCITDEDVRALSKCHFLNLFGTNITEESVKLLKNCHKVILGSMKISKKRY